MNSNRLSKYSLSEIDILFKSHPILSKLNTTERYSVYNTAQNEILALLEPVSQLTNFGITDNTLTFSDTKERNTINGLSAEDEELLKIGTIGFNSLLNIIDLSANFSKDEKKVILNVAQDIIARLQNDYDEFGYYQLWYHIDPNITVSYTKKDLEFLTSFTQSIEDYAVITKNGISIINTGGYNVVDADLQFKTGFSYKLYTVTLDLIKNAEFSTNFIVAINSPIQETQTKEDLEFWTGFTVTVSSPVIFNVTKDNLEFYTGFSTTIT